MRVRLILVLVLLCAGLIQSAQAQGTSHTFPETGQTVSGAFWAYWQGHGGLAQQGYPISGEFTETSPLDGKPYTVQYFERAVFEKHPENAAPYDVLLSQLGTLAYKAKYPAGAPGQHANQAGGHYFAETGHRVGGAFWAYWQAHGGLAQQGYPISEEFTETSALDGKPYTVQYFERAVFEAHPENRPPYDVLLSQLGRLRYQAQQGVGPGSGQGNGQWWKPAPGLSWQWQISETLNGPVPGVAVYDSDLNDTSAAAVAAIHAQGGHAICYISVGTDEDWRPDHAQFPPAVVGKNYTGWPGERWLDIRRIDLLGPIMRARLDLCKAKGFDAVEPDNVDGYQADTGFPITRQDELAYMRWLATEAHARGLSIGQKNVPDLVGALLPNYDWALTESCFADGWCDQMSPFIQAGKAVFAAEYTESGITRDQFCPQARALGISAILKHLSLNSWREACPAP